MKTDHIVALIGRVREQANNLIVAELEKRGHGGGDSAFVRDFMESYLHGAPFSSTLEQSLESHAMALLAEESRRENGAAKDVSQWMQRLVTHGG